MRRNRLLTLLVLAITLIVPAAAQDDAPAAPIFDVFPVPPGSHPHDVAPAPDGTVWYTGQYRGTLGRLDPETGEVTEIELGAGSSPHGVIVGPDGAPWVTDSGLNAMVTVDPETEEVTVYELPADFPNANLNTAAFDMNGILWFTGQGGMYGSLDPETGEMNAYRAPRGRGPYGIDATPDGEVFFVSLAGSYLADVDEESGEIEVIDPLTPRAGTRRVWSDSTGKLWITEYNVGNLAVYDPAEETWREWRLPAGPSGEPYAVVVDEFDNVWISDFSTNSVLRFDPETEEFESFELSRPNATVRQMLDAPGEVWAAQSGIDSLLRITLETPEETDEEEE